MKVFLFIALLPILSCSTSKYKGKEVQLEDPGVVAEEKTTSTKKKVMAKKDPVKEAIKNFTNPKIIPTDPGVSVVPLKNDQENQVSDNEKPVPWEVGEKLIYEVSAIGLDAAEFSIEVKSFKSIQNQKAWNFFVAGGTTGFTTKVYYINFKAESFIGMDLNTLQYQTAAYEANEQKQSLEKFIKGSSNYHVYKKRNDKIEKNLTTPFTFPQDYVDPISFFYYLRVIKSGDSFTLLTNHKSKKIILESVSLEEIIINNTKFKTEKLILSFENKQHSVWREIGGKKRILKAQISLSFASGVITLKNP